MLWILFLKFREWVDIFIFLYLHIAWWKKRSVRTFLGTSHYPNSYMIKAKLCFNLGEKNKTILTLQACKLYSQVIVFSNPWWFLERNQAISTVKDASYHQIFANFMLNSFMQQLVSLHHSRSRLVTSAKQCQDPWSWPSMGSMNWEKFVYNFSLTWLANKTIAF